MTDRSPLTPPFDALHYSAWRGPAGRRACRWCGREVPAGRRKWCSPECVESFAISTPSGQEKFLENRDHGICALCGLDCPALMAQVLEARRHQALAPLLAQYPGLEIRLDRARLWECDHATPLVEGGEHTRQNLRTLCWRCHAAETARLAARRAKPKPPKPTIQGQAELFQENQ